MPEPKEKKDKEAKEHVDAASDDEEEPTIAQDIVVTKYNMAADIVNLVLKELIAKCQPGQNIGELCDYGDKELTERTQKVFKKEKEVKKGIAFPTCISINNCICHFSPLRSEPESQLKDGDLVKIDLGAHIDGFIATTAHTLVVGASKENKVKGRKADVILAAYHGAEAAIRKLKPHTKNMEVTDVINKVAEAYHCKPVENMLSHQLRRNKIDGEKQIIQNPGEKERSDMEKIEFEQHETYAIDVLVSSGEGKARMMDVRTTIYKKDNDLIYQLKLKSSRNFLNDVEKQYGTMPFTLRSFDDEAKAKMGVVECERHGLMKPYQVLYEREGEVVAQFKWTVLLMPNGLLKITGLPVDLDLYESEHKITDDKILQLLQTSLKPNKKKKKAASKGKDGAGDAAPICESHA